jgi:hypothetical protein
MVVVYVKSDGTVVTQVVNAGEEFIPTQAGVVTIQPNELSQLVVGFNDLRGAPVAALRVEEPIRIYVSPLAGENSSIKR